MTITGKIQKSVMREQTIAKLGVKAEKTAGRLAGPRASNVRTSGLGNRCSIQLSYGDTRAISAQTRYSGLVRT